MVGLLGLAYWLGTQRSAPSVSNAEAVLSPESAPVVEATAAPAPEDPLKAARALLASRDYAGALSKFEAINEKRSADPEVLRSIGICFLNLGKPADALIWFFRAVAVEPGNGINHAWLGRTYEQLKVLSSAERWYEDAVARLPSGEELTRAQDALARIQAKLLSEKFNFRRGPNPVGNPGRVERSSGDSGGPPAKFVDSADDDEPSGPLLVERITSDRLAAVKRLWRKKGPAAALKELKRMLEEEPDDPELLRELGICALENGDFVEAIESLKAARSEDSADWQTQLFLARAYEKKGDVAMALTHYQSAQHRPGSKEYAAWFKAKVAGLQQKFSQPKAPAKNPN